MYDGTLKDAPLFQISDPFVLRTLVNVASIERTLLFDTRAEASDVLGSFRGGGAAYTLDGFQVRSFG
jgi:structural maintenance of chromosomes protein 6